MNQHEPKPANLRPTGKATRYVTNTTHITPIRLDQTSAHALQQLKRMLSSEIDSRDKVSTSLVVRRSLRFYHQALMGERSGGRVSIAEERQAVRETSRLPLR